MMTPIVPPSPRRRAGWDIALTIVILVLAAIGLAVGGFIDFIGLAFTDYCPPATCNVDRAVAGVSSGILAGVVIFVVGTVIAIILLITRRRGWWVGLSTAVLVGAAVVTAGVLYASAVGMF